MNTKIIIEVLGLLILIGIIMYMIKPVKKDKEGFKMWSFSDNSWHARYYKWVTSSTRFPQGGCEYFWIMVGLCLCSVFIFFFYGIYKSIVFIDSLFPNKPEKEKTSQEWTEYYAKKVRREERIKKASSISAKVFVTLVLLAILCAIVYCILNGSKDQWSKLFIALGVIVVTLGSVITLTWLFTETPVKVIGKYLAIPFIWLWKPFAYTGSMIKAIYTKSCPKITWNYEKQEQEEGDVSIPLQPMD